MKIWFDVLTPKEVLFFEPMAESLRESHQVLCTSRDYREVNELARIRGMKMKVAGRYGGATLAGKLEASLSRMTELLSIVGRFSPDVAVSSCSPDAAHVSFMLGIPHIGFSNSPHHDVTLRLSVPLLHRLLISGSTRKNQFTKFGIDPSKVVQYTGMDEYVIVRNRPASRRLPFTRRPGKKIVVFRTYEAQAAYATKSVDMVSLITALASGLDDCHLIVLGRYPEEIESLHGSVGDVVTVLDRVVDSGQILALCDVFVGSGGTMTSEAALRGVPTVSYNAVPNVEERNLVRRGLVVRAETGPEIVRLTRKLLLRDPAPLRRKAAQYRATMDDPFRALQKELDSLRRDVAP